MGLPGALIPVPGVWQPFVHPHPPATSYSYWGSTFVLPTPSTRVLIRGTAHRVDGGNGVIFWVWSAVPPTGAVPIGYDINAILIGISFISHGPSHPNAHPFDAVAVEATPVDWYHYIKTDVPVAAITAWYPPPGTETAESALFYPGGSPLVYDVAPTVYTVIEGGWKVGEDVIAM